MPTIETKIAQALQGRVASLGLAYSVFWTDDAPTTPPASDGQAEPFIEAHHEPNRSVRRLVKPNAPHERPGLLLLTLCWPLTRVGSGSGKTHRDAIREIGGQIAEHFPAGLCMPFQGVSLSVTKAPDVLGGFRDDTLLRTQVRIEYSTFA